MTCLDVGALRCKQLRQQSHVARLTICARGALAAERHEQRVQLADARRAQQDLLCLKVVEESFGHCDTGAGLRPGCAECSGGGKQHTAVVLLVRKLLKSS